MAGLGRHRTTRGIAPATPDWEPFLLPPDRIRRVVLCAGQIYYRLRCAQGLLGASSSAACCLCRPPCRRPQPPPAAAHGLRGRRGAAATRGARGASGTSCWFAWSSSRLPTRPCDEGARPSQLSALFRFTSPLLMQHARAPGGRLPARRRWCRSTGMRSWCGARRSPRTWAPTGMCSPGWKPPCATSPRPPLACLPRRCTTWAAPLPRPQVRACRRLLLHQNSLCDPIASALDVTLGFGLVRQRPRPASFTRRRPRRSWMQH